MWWEYTIAIQDIIEVEYVEYIWCCRVDAVGGIFSNVAHIVRSNTKPTFIAAMDMHAFVPPLISTLIDKLTEKR